ncbi:hypothetical protein PLICRDRAFT_29488 [Plicaturopsis crispa FD-325 SS-3]|nr:hypothetical protein PLICRDRAFT_29488 [Plicaturopsis crispa FD-325 SS-3]
MAVRIGLEAEFGRGVQDQTTGALWGSSQRRRADAECEWDKCEWGMCEREDRVQFTDTPTLAFTGAQPTGGATSYHAAVLKNLLARSSPPNVEDIVGLTALHQFTMSLLPDRPLAPPPRGRRRLEPPHIATQRQPAPPWYPHDEPPRTRPTPQTCCSSWVRTTTCRTQTAQSRSRSRATAATGRVRRSQVDRADERAARAADGAQGV